MSQPITFRVAAALVGLVAMIAGLALAFAGPSSDDPGEGNRSSGLGWTSALLGLLLIVLSLAACAAAPRAIVQDKIIKEAVPIAIQPIRASDIPVAPPALGPRPPSAQQAADAAFAAHCRDVAFVIDAFPLLRLSAGLPPAQAPLYPECLLRGR